MNMNKTYKWFRFAVCLLPFAVIVFALWHFNWTDGASGIGDILFHIDQYFRWGWFNTMFNTIAQETGLFAITEYNSWVFTLVGYYAMLWVLDIVFTVLTFIPRFIINRFGGDLV